MKYDLPYFSHDNNARNHPKMKALITEFGYEGYGRFWALNERIAESGSCIDISRKVNKLDLAKELGFDGKGLDNFLKFLSDPEIDLINIKENKISTDRITELYINVMEYRETERIRKYKKTGKQENPDGKSDFPHGKQENPDGKDNRVNKSKVNKSKEEIGGSIEPTPSQIKSLELAELLLTKHREVIPDYLLGKDDRKTIERWAVDIELLIRIDKKPYEAVKQVILWAKEPGTFWFPNIQSGKKLREKYELLFSQMQIKTKKTDPPERVSYIPDFDQSEEWRRKQKEHEEIVLKEQKEGNNKSLKVAYKQMIKDKYYGSNL